VAPDEGLERFRVDADASPNADGLKLTAGNERVNRSLTHVELVSGFCFGEKGLRPNLLFEGVQFEADRFSNG